jgi:presenilin-like A22 family membrane protease
MKHSWRTTLILVAFFLLAQVIGLVIINNYIDQPISKDTGQIVMKPLPLNLERPQIENKSAAYIPITLSILLGTGLILLLIRFKQTMVMRIWLLGVVWITLSSAFYSFFPHFSSIILALILAGWKMFKPNTIIHNFTELFIYGGLAAFLIDFINIKAAAIMLLVISLYDMIAVWHTKHMVHLAKFQSEHHLFAGLFIPSSRIKTKGRNKMTTSIKKGVTAAVLGGGDIGFPLLFAGVILKDFGFLYALVIALTASIALTLLLVYSKKDKFYPAMPFLSAGCILGYLSLTLF